ncbi:MAG: hypothetical protein DRR08_13620 [Candidatus Parabeggiatoa sp. nov. 2]|nr:MAG: hypothetical protein B6247_29445 [Beggiatoa sp. 4572_84]RKZ59553.1 MAG: hypothetical protein DRR08_13620 [Gammaproteobacteria bacterium]HEC85337.1 hypothetical protein [Thioploca sp.]
MPFSHSSQISTIIQYIEQLNPVSLLDVGIGMGQYGFLTRNYLEYLNLFQVNGRHGKQRPKQEWRVRIDGIEGCDGYITPVHKYCYNQLMIGDALEILPTLPDNGYELVLAIDILEHVSKTDGLMFISHIKRVASRAALISTPKAFIPQTVEVNPYENHRSLWEREELIENGFSQILENEMSWIVVSELRC